MEKLLRETYTCFLLSYATVRGQRLYDIRELLRLPPQKRAITFLQRDTVLEPNGNRVAFQILRRRIQAALVA